MFNKGGKKKTVAERRMVQVKTKEKKEKKTSERFAAERRTLVNRPLHL